MQGERTAIEQPERAGGDEAVLVLFAGVNWVAHAVAGIVLIYLASPKEGTPEWNMEMAVLGAALVMWGTMSSSACSLLTKISRNAFVTANNSMVTIEAIRNITSAISTASREKIEEAEKRARES